MANTFPRQDVSEAEKERDGKAWYKQATNYGADRFCGSHSVRTGRIQRMQNAYNGVLTVGEFDYIDKAYGGENKVKYIDYRLSRTKCDLLGGEQLMIPLKGNVYVINPEARIEYLDEISVPVGLHYTQDKIKALREQVGVDVFNGMPMPQVPEGQTIFQTLPGKSKVEVVMQKIIDHQIEEMKLKRKLHSNFIDTILTSECAGKVEINSEGELVFRSIPIEDAIFDESKNDPFCDNSPGLGERRVMFYHEIVKAFNLSKEDADELWEMQENTPTCDFPEINYPTINGAKAFSVYTYQWYGLQAERVKVYQDKATGKEKEAFLSDEYYQGNAKKLHNEEKKGKYKIVTKWKTVLYEGTRIGHNKYVNMGLVENMPASLSRPSWTMNQYVVMLFGTVGGVRVSIKQLTEHLDKTYNFIMFQINRELAKAKGKVVGIDMAALKKGTTQNQALYNLTNEGVVFFNSSEDGNEGAKTFEQQIGLGQVDLGVSTTINTLIPLKVDIEQTVDRITGILNTRSGIIQASATVSNTQQSLQASRTTTAALFYFFGEYIERIIRLTLEMSKISWGVLRPDIGKMMLGVEKFQFLSGIENIAFHDYGYQMADITKDQTVRDMLRQFYPVVLNSSPDLLPDILEAELADTATEAQAIMSRAMQVINDRKQQEAVMANEAAMQREQVAANAPVAVQQEKVKGDLMKEAAKGNNAAVLEGQKAANQAVLQRNQAAHAPEKSSKK